MDVFSNPVSEGVRVPVSVTPIFAVLRMNVTSTLSTHVLPNSPEVVFYEVPVRFLSYQVGPLPDKLLRYTFPEAVIALSPSASEFVDHVG